MSVKNNARHRSFASSAPEEAPELEPVTFDIAGETFTAKPDIQGLVLIDFLEASDGGGVDSIVAFRKFLKEALGEEEYARFDKHARDSKITIDVETIAKIVAFLVEEYASRPTKASAQ